jgi:VWFA-related protein
LASSGVNSISPSGNVSVPNVITFRSGVEEVQVLFTVHDGNQLVRDVTGDQFTILEDGEPVRAITTFRQQSDLPLRAAVLVDRSDSMKKGFAAELQAARRFLERVLRPASDSVLLADFSTHISIKPSTVPSAQVISTQLGTVEVNGLTALYDSLLEASRSGIMNGKELQPVRRVIILLSDGEDTYSRYSLEDAIRALQRSEIVVYTITAHSPRYQRSGDHVLQRLADATGGRAFLLKSFDAVDSTFGEIENELRTQYSVSFRPMAAGRCGYHSVQLRHRNPRLRIRAREGYYGCRP